MLTIQNGDVRMRAHVSRNAPEVFKRSAAADPEFMSELYLYLRGVVGATEVRNDAVSV